MTFFVRWPEGFVPEDHGWIKDEANSDMDGGGAVWARWEIPFRYPAVLTETLHDEATGAIGGWYNGPVKGSFPDPVTGQATLGDIHAELLRTDVGAGGK
ncbi:hypothetical protein [Streptomyces atratus]|uniref:hypothetical protein n=1 Tax=Streptomyces atratus TaxID=1893 RepID=UPI00366197CD